MNSQQDIKELLQKTRNLCSKAEKCSYDIVNYLQKRDLDYSEIQKIVSTLIEETYIDESRYALHFTNDKYKFNKWGRVKIKYNLRQKGINDKDIENAFLEIDNIEYRKILEDLIIKKNRTISKDLDEYTVKTKILRYATTKGFEFELANALIEELRIKKII